MLTVRWSEEATNDLVDLIDYIGVRDPGPGTRLREDIVATAEHLGGRPFLYRPGRVTRTREAVIRPNYLIVYQVGETWVAVPPVPHAAQRYP